MLTIQLHAFEGRSVDKVAESVCTITNVLKMLDFSHGIFFGVGVRAVEKPEW